MVSTLGVLITNNVELLQFFRIFFEAEIEHPKLLCYDY